MSDIAITHNQSRLEGHLCRECLCDNDSARGDFVNHLSARPIFRLTSKLRNPYLTSHSLKHSREVVVILVLFEYKTFSCPKNILSDNRLQWNTSGLWALVST